jgi:DNA-binding response OmpR family regulator
MTKTILVVEDDQFLSKILKLKLEKNGYTVVLGVDGADALEKIKAQPVNAVILDLMMPGRDGFAFLQDLKKVPSLKNIPIIVSSNLGQKDDKQKAMEYGATDYIVKSDTSLDELLHRVSLVLEK